MRRLTFEAPMYVLAAVVALMTAAPKTAKAPDAWTDPVPDQEQVALWAKKHRDGLLKAMPVAQGRWWRAHLAELEAKPEKLALGIAEQESTLLLGMGFLDEASLAADLAVILRPGSAIAASNRGAIRCEVPWLRYAAELEPGNPIILTNLGSCAVSAGKWDLAKAAFERALAKDYKHTNALLGMGQWYLHQRDFKKAWEYYARAGGVAMVKHAQATQQKNEKGKPVPPAEPIEAGRSRYGSAAPGGGGGTARVTDDELKFPPLPRWPGADAFIAGAKSREPLGKFYGEKWGKILKKGMDLVRSGPLKQVQEAEEKFEALSKAEKEAARLAEAVRPKWNDAEVMLGLELNYAWATGELDKAEAEYSAALDTMAPLLKALEAEHQARNDKIAQACPDTMDMAAVTACLKGAKREFASSCKESMNLNGRLFAIYNNAYHAWYARSTPVLERLYKVQAGWIRQLSDKTLWEAALMARDSIVFGPLATKMLEEEVQRMAFVGLGATSFGISATVCPEESPEVPQAEAQQPPKVKDPSQECPIPAEGWKIPPIDVLPFSFTVWCKEAAVTIRKGIGGAATRTDVAGEEFDLAEASAVLSIKHRFGTDKSTTVYLGVEGSLGATASAGHIEGVGGGLSASFGGEITFDRNGQLTDISGWKGGASLSGKALNGLYEGTAGFEAAAERGVPATVTVVNEHKSLLGP